MSAKLLQLLTIVALMLFASLKIKADGFIGTHGVTFDKCTGRATLEVGIGNFNGGTDDDWLGYANIFYKNTGGGWTQILQVTSSARSCGAFDCWNNSWGATAYGGFTYSDNSSPDYSKDINIYNRQDAGDNQLHFANISFNRLPADIEISATGSFSFKIEGQWNNHGNQNDATDNFGADISTASIHSIDGVTGLNATTDQCGKIDLNWPVPSQNWQISTTCTDYGNYSYEVYCNNVFMQTVTTNTWSVAVGTTLNGITFALGTQYSFNVRVKWTPTANTKFGSLYSPKSTFINGRSKPRPDQPTSLTASENKCTSEIDLNWQSSGSDIAYFKLFSELAPSIPTTLSSTSFTISPNDRNFTHNGVTRGVFYNYKLYSIDNCGNLSATGAFIKGISIADPLMPTGLVAVTNTVQGNIALSWNDNANNETKYQVIKSDNDGNSFTYEINANSGTGVVTYTDNLVSACKVYTYKVKVFNDCVLNGILSASSNTVILPPPDISASFNSTNNKLVASKGYFGNRVELNWSIANTSAVNYFKIYRKQLGIPLDSVQIGSVPVGTALYVDNTADARVFYRYTIIGIKSCNGAEELTNTSSDVGFRSPTGIVSGHIEYTGGIAVSGAKVLVNSTTGNAGNSLKFSPTGTLSIVDASKLEPGAQMRCEFWMKPTVATGTIINKPDAFNFRHNGSNWLASIYTGTNTTPASVTIPLTYTVPVTITNTNTTVTTTTVNPGYTSTTTVVTGTNNVTITTVSTVTNVATSYTITNVSTTVTLSSATNTSLAQNQWHHVSMIYDGSVFKTFVNGILQGSVTATGSIADNANNLVFGSATSDFYLDEFRLIGKAETDSVIKLEVNRILNGDEPQFKCNLHFDENTGSFAYDPSKVGNIYNANHAQFNAANVAWDADIPTVAQLGYYGVTNALGNYNVSGIRYLGTGENYNLVPQYQTHQFSPNTRAVYIGDASYVYNNQDFEDISAFPVTGTLFYKNTTCPVPGAGLLIDGQAVIKNGQPVSTDAFGTFSMTVPIGNHFITIAKTQHYMESGRYPLAGTHNFQEPISGIEFIDSTRVRVVGRVVGGHIEAGKKPGIGRSKNNIGKANISFASPLTGTPCYTTSVITNSATGEYAILMPPLDYKVIDAYVITNSLVINKSKLSNTNNVLSLSNPLVENKVVDSVKVLGVFTGIIDSAKYHKRLDFIYNETKKDILVTRLDNSIFIGEDTLKEGTTKIALKPIPTNTASLGTYGWGPFNWPIFEQNKPYYLKFKITENYLNTDNNKTDSVPLSGKAKFNNELVQGNDPNSIVTFTAGTGNYSFYCGAPNTATSAVHPDLHYTKDLQIQFLIDGASPVNWEPNATFVDKDYHAIVLGVETQGSGVATNGPEKVQFILRDPPGSGSYAKWSNTTSVAKRHSYSAGGSTNQGVSLKISLGPKITAGVGIINEVETHNSITTGLQTSFGGRDTDDTIREITTGFAVQTRSEPDFVGASADIFVGDSKNWLFGPTINIELIDVSKCTPNCFGPVIGGKRLSRMLGFKIAEGAARTKFAYTQKEIETNVIPSLEAIRNSILTKPGGRYTYTLSTTDWKFGSNNDDPLWAGSVSSSDPRDYAFADTTGPSYTFKGRGKGVKDSVREINNQIRLWKEVLRDNERDKHIAFSNSSSAKFDQNYTLGSALITVNNTNTFTDTKESVFEFQMDESVLGSIGGTINKVGVITSPNLTLKQQTENIVSTTNVNTNATEYFFTDGDHGDIISFDSYKTHYGNVFITRGGQTMCPYEGPLVLNYYNPSNPNAYISSHTAKFGTGISLNNATLKREVPQINVVSSPALYNIPSDQEAIYQVQISNQSLLTINNSVKFRLYTPSGSNPNGAYIKVDGEAINALNSFSVAAGASLLKTITIAKGPLEIEYDSLMVIVASNCSDKIADTIFLSAHFIPTCTDLSFQTPVNNFVINNNNNSFQNVVIENYDYNYGYAPNTVQVSTGTYTYIATSTNTLTGLTTTAVATGTNYASVPVAAHPNYGLERIGFEFKPANSSQWLQIQDFYKATSAAQAAGTNTIYVIPNGQIYTQYGWTVTPQSFADGEYEIRAASYCYNKTGSVSVVYSPVHQGVMDRINPHPFGTPSPGDGILDPNDDISIQFNETIDISSLNYAPASNPNSTFDIRGVLNGTDIRHSESLNFDGTSDYAEVTGGASLQKRNFTFEFWAKLNNTNVDQTVISQGTDPNQRMSIGFDNSNKLKFQLGNMTAVTTNPVTLPTDWHHYAVVYDYANTDASLFVDGSLAGTNNNFVIDYTGTGKLAFGKALPANNEYFGGNMHEVRLWNKAKTQAEVAVTMNEILNRNQANLVYNWKMDEADGQFVKDDIRNRDANITGATWEINPNGAAVNLDGVDDYIEVTSSTIPVTKEMDFTMEFWFNSNQTSAATLFSNGKADGLGADSLLSWNIDKDASGQIHVKHKGLDFVAVNNNYFDGNWHHFALVLQRTGNLSAYVDGNLQNSVLSTSFNELGGANMYLGVRSYFNGSVQNLSNYYQGQLDEFRFWNASRKTEQIKRDKQNRMLGDEHALQAFVPFEHYAVVLGTPSLTPTFNDQALNNLTVTAQNGPTLVSTTPKIKLPRPVEKVNFTYSLNNDKIILTTTTDPALIENVTLDITVKNAYDMRGNKMQSPKTWIAYINKNQVKWQDDEFSFEKYPDEVVTFTAPIVNTGGALKAFTVGNMPSWMTANVTSGNIAPNSTENIVFTLPAGTNIGEYTADVSVTTDFGYDEMLRVNLKVKGIAPTWTVNPSNYQFSMNVFGEFKIDNVLNTNPNSMIAAMHNGTVCGVANLQYVSAYDKYVAYLNVYNNKSTGDSIQFNIYDASTGLTFVNVSPNLLFADNSIHGTVGAPITFVANTQIRRDIPLNAGWTWVSFPLETNKLTNANLLMSDVNATTGDLIAGQGNGAFDQYATGLNWLGGISSGAGFKNNQSYKVKISTVDTIVHIGSRIHPDSAKAVIHVNTGWNWIGFVANKNVTVNEAMGNFNATTGDILKSQYEFAYYDNALGWVGSLTHMKPTLGYMLQSASTGTFTYPLSSFLTKVIPVQENPATQNLYPYTPERYNLTMTSIVKGNICHEALEQGHVMLGAFDHTNTLRGFANAIKNNTTNTYHYFLTTYGNTDGEALSLKYFNSTNVLILPTPQTIMFTSDAALGTLLKPVEANVPDSLTCKMVLNTTVGQLNNQTNLSVYPNPFNDHVTILFNNAISGEVELVDVLGKVVYRATIKNKKEYKIPLNTTISEGVYYLRLTGDVNEQVKLVKTQ